jgi:hypothetical protein
VTGRDDALGVRDDRAVVEKEVDVISGRQQRTNVSLKHEVRTHRPFDRLDDLGVSSVNQVTELLAESPLRRR